MKMSAEGAELRAKEEVVMSFRLAMHSVVRLVPVLAALALTACDRGYTVHPVIGDTMPTVDAAEIEGLWIMKDSEDYWVLQVSKPGVGRRECREAGIRVWQGSDTIEQPPSMEGSVCLARVASQTLAELMTPSEPALYQHFLVRPERDRIAVCGGVSVWAILKGSPERDPRLFSLEGLDYTIRRNGEAEDIFVTSGPDDLRTYLLRNLPRLAEVCDASKEDDPTPGWLVFERVSPAPGADSPAGTEVIGESAPQR